MTSFKFGSAECKLLVVFVCYVIAGILGITSFMLNARDAPTFIEAVGKYFLCEATPSPGQQCTKEYRHYHHPVVQAISILCLVLIPLVNLTFVMKSIKVKNLLKLVRRMTQKIRN